MLLRSDLTGTSEAFQVCRAVGDSPERTGLEVRFPFDGGTACVINTHANSHVQAGPAKPHELPRVREYIAGMKVLAERVTRARADGCRVIVTGDLNWAWTPRIGQWLWSPRSTFGRLGMVSQYDYGILPRPKGDARPIEYVLFDPREFTFKGQRFIGPEKSDHPFHEVDLEIKESK